MQLARNLWLDSDKHWKRKASELMIALHLESKLSKRQIFEFYAHEVYLGGRGTFSINGFGEAARAMFNKDVRKLTLPEAATLAGLIQRPSYFNPFLHPRRALERRNVVLRLMRENKYISATQYAAAVSAPLGLSPETTELSDSQYFLDLAGDELQRDLESDEFRGMAKVQTTLDLRLQKAAEDAVRDGMAKVDKELKRRHKAGPISASPQVALIALDPHTGEIRALCGGRSYSATQLNRALAKRPPGSVFKPFVYAAALSTAVQPSPQVFTESSTVVDQPTTFTFANQTYSPDNLQHQFHGQVTLRLALAKSMNVAAVQVV
jgi:penicillin-binding protein 1B